MNRVNLIPSEWRIAASVDRRIARWKLICIAYALVIALAAVAARTCVGGDETSLHYELTRTEQQIESLNRLIGELRPALAETQAQLGVAQAIGDQPDWSLLLLIVGRAASDEIVLTRMQLSPNEAVPAPAPRSPTSRPTTNGPQVPLGSEPQARRLKLELSGLGKTQTEVSGFVVRLEQTRLFDQVKLIRTAREAAGASDALAFQIDAVFRAGKRVRS